MPNLVPVSLSLWAGIYQVLFAFRVGAPVVLMERFTTTEFARLVQKFGVRSAVLPPAAMTMLADDPRVDSLEPLRIVRSITAPLAPREARRFARRFPVRILNSYGQTELGGEVVGWTVDDARRFGATKLGAAGRPHPGVEVRVDAVPPGGGAGAADATGSGAAVTGELLVRTAETGRARSGTLAGRVTPDGWFRTGDIGRVDDDGFVWIEGRLSDTVNRGGLKVFPSEVEDVLAGAPGVADVAVAGIPDPRLGEVPWAFVVLDPGAELDPAALEARCREVLAPYKVPARYVAVEVLPRNEVGKVLRRELAARVPRTSAPPPPPLPT